MPSTATHPHPAGPADQQSEDAQYYRRVLRELIDMGTDLARALPSMPRGSAVPDGSRARIGRVNSIGAQR